MHENEGKTEESTERRRVLGAVVWAAPVIAASVAAPAYAASNNESPA